MRCRCLGQSLYICLIYQQHYFYNYIYDTHYSFFYEFDDLVHCIKSHDFIIVDYCVFNATRNEFAWIHFHCHHDGHRQRNNDYLRNS